MILDQKGNEIESPDFSKGYLVEHEEVIHHDAIKAQQSKTELVEVAPNLFKEVTTPQVFPVPAWDETRKWQEYILYTPKELAERAAQAEADAAARAEAEAQAKAEEEEREAEKAVIGSLPAAFEELASVVAELADNQETMAVAIEELGTLHEGE